jgi:hypothetical protein
MSKVVKGIKKVFKKVVKVVKKVAPIILAAAAIYFTAGAAMGFLPAGATAGSAAAGSMGLTGTMGGVVSGAVTQAGYGAVIGGAMSKAGGGSFSEGAPKGALAGAITGGITGGINPAGAGVQPTGGVQAPTASGVDPTTMSAADEAAAMGMKNFSPETGVTGGTVTPPPVGGGVTSPAKGLLTQGGWLERNQALAGNIIGGLGQGMMAKGAGDAEIDALREKQNLINKNYEGVNPGAGFTPIASGTEQRRRPMERFSPESYSSYEYQYNPQTGRIERVNLGG